MMEKKRSIMFVLIGMFSIGLGAKILFPSYYFVFDAFLKFPQIVSKTGFFVWLQSTVYSTVLPICLIFSGIAFLFFKRWGKVFIQLGFILELAYRLIGLILFWSYCFETKQSPLYESATMTSMIPSYLIVFAEIIALYYLTCPTVKEQFK
jgi:hypothetical protein